MVAVVRATSAHAAAIRQIDGLSRSTARVLEYDLDADDRCCLVALDAGAAPAGADAMPVAGSATCAAGGSAPANDDGRGTSDSEGRIVGYAAALLQLDEAHVIDVAVAPQARRRGIATALLDELDTKMYARGATASTLEVAADNVSARQLYRQRGYVVEGRRRKYYPDGQDALILWRRDEGR